MLNNLILNILNSKFKKFLVYLMTAVLFFGSVYMIPLELVKAKMLPGKDSDSFSLYVDLPTNSNRFKTKEVSSCIANYLLDETAVETVSVFLGEGQPLDFAGMVKGSALKSSANQAEIMVNIKKAKHRDERSYNMIHRIRPLIKQKCSKHNATIKFIELPSGPPTLADIVAEVTGGDSFESQRKLAYKIAKILKKQKTLVDVDVIADETTFKYSIILNKNKILQSGISFEQIKKMLYVAFEGSDIGVINEGDAENQIKLFLRLDDKRLLNKGDEEDIKNKLFALKLMNPMGLMIPMSNFVKIKKVKQAPTIHSKNLKKIVNVLATTDDDSQIYPLLDAREDMIKELADDYIVTKTTMLNLGFEDKKTGEQFDMVWDGELKVTIDTFIELGVAFIGALVLIFFLMVVYYKNFALAGAIVMASFLSLIGVIVGHYVMDQITADRFYLTATSLIGFIGLIGINSRNSLLIVDFAKQLIKNDKLQVNEAIAKATATRAKPILLTVLAIVFASSLLASDAVFGGLGVALIGGTIFAYLVSLFFVPLSIQNSLIKGESDFKDFK